MDFDLDSVPGKLTADDSNFKIEVKGQTELIALCWFHKDAAGNFLVDKSPRFVAEECHYKEELGYVVATPETKAILGPGKDRIQTIVVVYNTDKNGQPAKPFDFTVKRWVLDKGRLETLLNHHKSAPAGGGLQFIDIKVIAPKNKDPKYQAMDFFPQQRALWRMKPAIMERVLSRVREIEEKMSLGKKMSGEEVRALLGMEASPAEAVGSAASNLDFNDLIDGNA